MITITIDDNNGNIKKFNLSNQDEKSLLYDISDLKTWFENAVKHKVRQNKNEMIHETILFPSKHLSKADKTAIVNMIVKDGEVLKNVKDMSDIIKNEIIKRSKLKKKGK